MQHRSRAPCQLGAFNTELCTPGALQTSLLAMVEELFCPASDGTRLSGALLAGAALQLLPLVLTRRTSMLELSKKHVYQGGRLVRLTCRVAASLRSTLTPIMV